MNIISRESLVVVLLVAAVSASAAPKSKSMSVAAPQTVPAPETAPAPAVPVVAQEKAWEWDRRIGLQLAGLYPTPGGIGVGLNFRLNDDFRFGIGYATIFSFSTYGVNAKYLFMREWAVRPFVGAQLNRTETIWDEIIQSAFGVPKEEQENIGIWHGGIDVGFDFLAGNGFNIGVGASYLIVDKADLEVETKIWPFVYLGWYF